MVEPQSSKLMTRVRFPSSALRSPRQTNGGLLAGRSVVASAPALGAGDRRFESCRPDCHTDCTSPNAPPDTIKEKPCEERRRDAEPDPGQDHRRGALRGAQAEPRRGVPGHRQADQHPRLPQGQGAAAGDRPPGRPRRGPRRGDQRRAAEALRRRRCRRTTCSRWPSRRSTSPSSRTTRCSSSPPRSTCGRRSRSRRTTASSVQVDDVTVSDDDIDEQVESLRERFATLKDVERAAPGRRRHHHRPQGHPRRRGRRGRRGQRLLLQGRLRRHARGHRRRPARPERRRGDDVHLLAARRRPVRRGGRGHRQAVRRQGAGAARARRRLRPDRLGVRHRRRSCATTSPPGSSAASASSRPPPPATPCSSSCSTPPRSRCPTACVDRGARRSPPGDRAAADVRRHDDGAVPRQREADRRRVRGRAREAGPRRDGLAVPARRDRQGRGDRRRAGRAVSRT